MKLILLVILCLLAGGIWGYNIGALEPRVTGTATLDDMHAIYNHIKIHEDGSYEGETVSGEKVAGCIAGALCND